VSCEWCFATFARLDLKKRHVKKKHEGSDPPNSILQSPILAECRRSSPLPDGLEVNAGNNTHCQGDVDNDGFATEYLSRNQRGQKLMLPCLRQNDTAVDVDVQPVSTLPDEPSDHVVSQWAKYVAFYLTQGSPYAR
jgi:hypothetical protein